MATNFVDFWPMNATLKQRLGIREKELVLIPPPHTAVAKVPNKRVNVPFHELSGLSLKIILYLVYEYQNREKIYKDGLPAGVNIAVSWRRLARHIAPSSLKYVKGRHFDFFKDGLDRLMRTIIVDQVLTDEGLEEEAWAFIYKVRYNRETGIALINLNEEFGAMASNFTMVYLRDAFVLNHPRQIKLLMWACRFMNLNNDSFRTLSVKEIRKGLGLEDGYYDEWARVNDVLKKHVKVINALTSFHVDLESVKRGREVVAIRFDVSRDYRKRPGKAKLISLGV